MLIMNRDSKVNVTVWVQRVIIISLHSRESSHVYVVVSEKMGLMVLLCKLRYKSKHVFVYFLEYLFLQLIQSKCLVEGSLKARFLFDLAFIWSYD